MNKGTFHRSLDNAIDNFAGILARKSVRFIFSDEFKDIPAAKGLKLGDPVSDADIPTIHGWAKGECHRLFAPWMDLPDPAALDIPLRQLAEARAKLDNTKVAKLDDARGMSVSAQIPDQMKRVREKLDKWYGETISAIKYNYTGRFDRMRLMQVNTVLVLELTLRAHQDAVCRAQEDTLALVGNTADAIGAVTWFGGDNGKNTFFNLLTGMAGILGVFAPVSGGITAAVGGGLAGIAKDLVGQKHQNPIGGSRIDEVWANMVGALNRHKELYADGESKLATVIKNFDGLIHSPVQVDTDGDGNPVNMPGEELIQLTTPINTGDLRPVNV